MNLPDFEKKVYGKGRKGHFRFQSKILRAWYYKPTMQEALDAYSLRKVHPFLPVVQTSTLVLNSPVCR